MTSKKNPAKASIDFEVTLKKLESIAGRLENQETSLEDSMKAFEDGVNLTREAQEFLKKTEQRLQVLMDQNGEPIDTDFDSDFPDK